jgi:hypothetical protein
MTASSSKDRKRTELLSTVRADPAVSSLDPALVERVVDSFCSITPPPPDNTMYLATMAPGGLGGARSVKPGNITLNWRRLLTNVPESALGVWGADSDLIHMILAALVIWNKLWSHFAVEIHERQAAVLWAIWRHKDGHGKVDSTRVLEFVNVELHTYDRGSMSLAELESSLESLERMRCIRLREGRYSIIEWVRIQYHQ